MEIRGLDTILKAHPFFEGMSDEHIKLLAGCAANVTFDAGEVIFRQNEEANQFYVLREGKVGVDILTPSREVRIQTLEAGEVLGWSWLFPPFLWHFDAVAIEPTRALALDGKCLRGKCENDHELGYELLKRFSAIVVDRLQASRLQLLDIFAPSTD